MGTKNRSGDNYTSITRDNGNGTQTERTFVTREDRQNWLRNEHSEYRPSIPHQSRVVERKESDTD